MFSAELSPEYSQRGPMFFDAIIIGSGIAGLSLARELAKADHKIFIASKDAVTEGGSKYSQGGVAVCTPLNPDDSLEQHIEDTLKAGKGLCKEETVNKILSAGWTKVKEIIDLGVKFDADFNIEGLHSFKRIMHAADSTGRAILKPLLDKVSSDPKISLAQGAECTSLIKFEGIVVGARFKSITGESYDVFANSVIIATGGLASLYKDHTTPNFLTGNGIALAYDAGAKLENLEFIQFHPTVFKTKNKKRSHFLISEAVRGEGAQLRNIRKELFLHNYDPKAELATRDVVSRAIWEEMELTKSDHVYLDFSKIDEKTIKTKFPNIYQTCLENGYDICKSYIPVYPAAHYSIGGIQVDSQQSSSVPGLYAIGEVASNGLHGANRLASNSLLECIVSPSFAAEHILKQEYRDDSAATIAYNAKKENEYTQVIEYCSQYPELDSFEDKQKHQEELKWIKALMAQYLSGKRSQESIESLISSLENLKNSKEKQVALLVAQSALKRKESRGCHYRTDFPNTGASTSPTVLSLNEDVDTKVMSLQS